MSELANSAQTESSLMAAEGQGQSVEEVWEWQLKGMGIKLWWGLHNFEYIKIT